MRNTVLICTACRICSGQHGTGTGLSQVISFSCQPSFHQCFIFINLLLGGGAVGYGWL